MSKPVYAKCDYDCFNCGFKDCINNAPPTAAENKVLKEILNVRKRTETRGRVIRDKAVCNRSCHSYLSPF